MLKTNRERLLEVSVMGEVKTATFASTPPGYLGTPYMVTPEGIPKLVPLPGGIVYNVRTGDPAMGWEADTVCPGVSIGHTSPGPNVALMTYACIGNKAKIMSGESLGETGVVTGKYGNGPFLVVDFTPDVLEKMAIGDKVQVRALGTGLAIDGFEEIYLWNIAPDLLEQLIAKIDRNKLYIPVSNIIPAEIIGAGSGHSPERWETQVMTSDPDIVNEYSLDKLLFGDIVGITDYDTVGGMHIRKGALTIGIVGIGDSFMGGHGPGITPILSTRNLEKIEMSKEAGANIAPLVGINR